MDFVKTTLTTKEKLNFLKVLPGYAEGRLNQINNKINSSNNIQLHVVLQIGIAISQYLKSLVASLELGNIIAANVLFRSLVESFINIEYIMQDDTQKRAIAFLFEDFKIQRINIETFKNLILTKTSEAEQITELSTKEKCETQIKKIEKYKKDILSTLKNNFNIEVRESELRIPSIE